MEFLLDLAQENAYLCTIEGLDDITDLMDRIFVNVGLLSDFFC